MNIELSRDNAYQSLLDRISEVYTSGQCRALQSVNTVITETYWQIGHDIVEFEQGGKIRAEYGKALLATLSRDLTIRHGKGFSRSNLIYMRLLYRNYQKGQKPSDLLSWSHHVELLRIDDPLERSSVIYLEGGGESKELHSRCREGFRKLLEKNGFKGNMPRLVACGS